MAPVPRQRGPGRRPNTDRRWSEARAGLGGREGGGRKWNMAREQHFGTCSGSERKKLGHTDLESVPVAR